MFYTYVYYTQADASIPTYVGKGKGNRAYRHQKTKTRFGNHIQSQLRDDVFPIIAKFPQPSEQAAFDKEVRLIALYGRRDLGTGSLYNMTDGGDGISGLIRTAEHKARISVAHLGKIQKPHTAEAKAKISAAVKQRSPETQAKIIAGNRGQKRSDECRARMSAAAKNRTPELLAKNSASQRGKPKSESHKANLRAAWVRRKNKELQ